MAKLPGNRLIDRICERLGWGSGGVGGGSAAQRAAALTLLQESENWIAQQGSFKHLEREESVTLLTGTNIVAVPSWVDIGKTMSMGLPDGNGDVKILPSDRWRRDTKHTYGAWGLTTPATCKIAADSSGAFFFWFDRTNGSGGNLVYPLSAQQLPNTLADNGVAVSSLPEGYETSLLLKRAEFEGKREIRAIVTDQERADLAQQMERFFDQYRSSKEESRPDTESIRRKMSERLVEGA